MPTALTDSETIHFLVAVIRCTNNGKPDWNKVKEECNIASAHAASMRYFRILKRHQIGSTGSASSPSSSPKKARGKKNTGGADEVTPPTTPPPTTAVSPVTPRSTGRKRKQISSYKLPSSDSELSDLSEIDWDNTSVRGSPKKKTKMEPVVEVEVARSDGDE